MNILIQKSLNRKPLSVDFDRHTDSDQEFKTELVNLMIENMKELQESLQKANKQNNPKIFRESCHRVKPTTAILDDKELMDTIEELQRQTDENKKKNTIAMFNKMCEDIIKGLKDEIR